MGPSFVNIVCPHHARRIDRVRHGLPWPIQVLPRRIDVLPFGIIIGLEDIMPSLDIERLRTESLLVSVIPGVPFEHKKADAGRKHSCELSTAVEMNYRASV